MIKTELNIFFKKIPLRDFVLLQFFEWGEIRNYAYKIRPGLVKELAKMKDEKLVEDGKDDKGKIIPILKYPDGFDALDKVIKKWPIYSINFSEKIVKNVALRSAIDKIISNR